MRRGILVSVAVMSLALVVWGEVKVTAPAEPGGMEVLTKGSDLSNWEGNPKLWSIKDGVIRGETTAENQTKGNTFLMWKGGELKDFELRLSFRIDHGNAGVQYRSRHATEAKENNWVVAGYQAEVCNEPGNAGFLYHERGRGSLVIVGQKVVIDENGKKNVIGSLGDRAEIAKTYKNSDWNDYVIICKGNHVQQYLNGVQTIDLVDNDPKGRCMSGILALQIHAGPPMWVEYKDIRIKRLEEGK